MREVFYYNQDYVIRETAIPTQKVDGMCLLDEEGRANIYLNHKATDSKKKESIKHELLHYKDSDHYISAQAAEQRVRLQEPKYDIEFPKDDYIILHENE